MRESTASQHISTSMPVGLYVHLPWCARKCPYCDFNSYRIEGQVPESAYVDALLADLRFELGQYESPRVATIFIGGGTPSLFSAAAIQSLLAGIGSLLEVDPRAEITLETNPDSVTEGKLEGWRKAGVNRLSIGVQSFDDGCLSRIGRLHDAAAAMRAARSAARVFERVNLDLMYGLPGQTTACAARDLDLAIGLEPEHLSIYSLTLEPGTPFFNNPPPLPADDTIADMEGAIRVATTAAGYRRYEVSAYARPGSRSLHNLNYWRFGDYLGVGAGAHGKISTARGTWRTRRVANPATYLRTAGSAVAVIERRRLPAHDLAFEFLLNALRLPRGVTIELFESRTGQPYSAIAETLATCQKMGLMTRAKDRIATTAKGFRYLNSVLEMFLPNPDRSQTAGSPRPSRPVAATAR